MKILMLSTDRKIFDKNSSVRERMIEYGKIVEELHILIFTRGGQKEIKLSDNVYAYPTNTPLKLAYFPRAYKLGKRILKNGGHLYRD